MVRDFKLLVADVDGTLTDGGIYSDECGNEFKRFCVRDAAGFFAARSIGIKTMILTGRESKATVRRSKELKIDYIYQNIREKKEFLSKFVEEQDVLMSQVIVIGDDLNDVSVMKLAGFVGCPADSCREVKEIADYVSDASGGQGVVRDVVEHLFRKWGIWAKAVKDVYGTGV